MNQTTDKNLVERLMLDDAIYKLNQGKGVYTPCEYCQEMTEVFTLTKFRIEDDENLNVCSKCENYLSDIADNPDREDSFEDSKNEALEWFNRDTIQSLSQIW